MTVLSDPMPMNPEAQSSKQPPSTLMPPRYPLSKGANAFAVNLTTLSTFSRPDLIEHWRTHFHAPPPKHLSSAFMIKAISFAIQSAALGGVPKSLTRQLRSIDTGRAAKAPTKHQIKPGTHLVREWNGRSYQVEVTSDGYVFYGTTYRSLSAIAKRITGTHWSGPRFFGLAAG